MQVKDDIFLGSEWLAEITSGTFKGWDDLAFLRQNWDGPLILKGIQSVHVSLACIILKSVAHSPSPAHAGRGNRSATRR